MTNHEDETSGRRSRWRLVGIALAVVLGSAAGIVLVPDAASAEVHTWRTSDVNGVRAEGRGTGHDGICDIVGTIRDTSNDGYRAGVQIADPPNNLGQPWSYHRVILPAGDPGMGFSRSYSYGHDGMSVQVRAIKLKRTSAGNLHVTHRGEWRYVCHGFVPAS